MWSADTARAVMSEAEVVTPSRVRAAGVAMAGFRVRTTGSAAMTVVPYPAVTLFLDFSESIVVDGDGGRQRGSVVAGLAPRAVLSGSVRDIECMQVRLSPVVAHAVLDDAPGIGGVLAPLGDLWGRDTGRFEERLRAAASWEERFAVVEAALAGRHDARRAADPEIVFAWRRMVRARGRIRIGDLAAETGWSRKRLWSRFRAQLGLTPKRAAQLVRFDAAAHRLAAGESAAVVAAGSGYADQSHLHREVLAFAGVTPAAVAAAPWLVVDPVAWPATACLSPA